jgi:hypothetical protein
MALRLTNPAGRITFDAGRGAGAMALTAQPGLNLTFDYAQDGGVNPLLGRRGKAPHKPASWADRLLHPQAVVPIYPQLLGFASFSHCRAQAR